MLSLGSSLNFSTSCYTGSSINNSSFLSIEAHSATMVNLWDDLRAHQALPQCPVWQQERQAATSNEESNNSEDDCSESELSTETTSIMSRSSSRQLIPSPAAQAKQARALSNLYGNKATERDYDRVIRQYKQFAATMYGSDNFQVERVADWMTFNAHRPKIQQFREVTLLDKDGRPKKVKKRNPTWKFTREEYQRVIAKAFSWKPGDPMPTDVEEGLQNLDLHWSAIQKICPDHLKQKLRDHSGIKVSISWNKHKLNVIISHLYLTG